MARSAAAALTVLESLRVLYDLGGDASLGSREVLALFERIGIDGFTTEQGPYFLMVGTVLRLLLGHVCAHSKAMFAAMASDLEILSRDIDDAMFDDIATHFGDTDL